MRLQSAKCLVGNSIIDGLKSRLMQYLKHVVEDDVLFTKVISKFKPVTSTSSENAYSTFYRLNKNTKIIFVNVMEAKRFFVIV